MPSIQITSYLLPYHYRSFCGTFGAHSITATLRGGGPKKAEPTNTNKRSRRARSRPLHNHEHRQHQFHEHRERSEQDGYFAGFPIDPDATEPYISLRGYVPSLGDHNYNEANQNGATGYSFIARQMIFQRNQRPSESNPQSAQATVPSAYPQASSLSSSSLEPQPDLQHTPNHSQVPNGIQQPPHGYFSSGHRPGSSPYISPYANPNASHIREGHYQQAARVQPTSTSRPISLYWDPYNDRENHPGTNAEPHQAPPTTLNPAQYLITPGQPVPPSMFDPAATALVPSQAEMGRFGHQGQPIGSSNANLQQSQLPRLPNGYPSGVQLDLYSRPVTSTPYSRPTVPYTYQSQSQQRPHAPQGAYPAPGSSQPSSFQIPSAQAPQGLTPIANTQWTNTASSAPQNAALQLPGQPGSSYYYSSLQHHPHNTPVSAQFPTSNQTQHIQAHGLHLPVPARLQAQLQRQYATQQGYPYALYADGNRSWAQATNTHTATDPRLRPGALLQLPPPPPPPPSPVQHRQGPGGGLEQAQATNTHHVTDPRLRPGSRLQLPPPPPPPPSPVQHGQGRGRGVEQAQAQNQEPCVLCNTTEHSLRSCPHMVNAAPQQFHAAQVHAAQVRAQAQGSSQPPSQVQAQGQNAYFRGSRAETVEIRIEEEEEACHEDSGSGEGEDGASTESEGECTE